MIMFNFYFYFISPYRRSSILSIQWPPSWAI
jgi:hypothetical protein